MHPVERQILQIVSRLAPWLSPLPTAYLVGRAVMLHLEWPLLVAIVAALIVETLGLATGITALELYQYNRSKRQTDPVASLALAIALVAIYFCSAIILTVALDILPVLSVYAPAIFPVLSLVGVLNLALRSDHEQRLVAIEQAKAERKAERAAHKAEPKIIEQAPVAPEAEPSNLAYVCVQCGASFERQKQLSGHMVKHAKGNGYRNISVEEQKENI